MSNETINAVAEAFLAASLPIDPSSMDKAAQNAIDFYANAPAKIQLAENEVADRFAELWTLWTSGDGNPPKELKDLVQRAISADPDMMSLSRKYFTLEKTLEKTHFMPRHYAVALLGCAPLIRTLVEEQRLGLDRMRAILNVPNARFKAIEAVISGIGIRPPFEPSDIRSIHEFDEKSVADYYGDTEPDEADKTLRGLLMGVPRAEALWENVLELVLIGFAPYLFMLYYELLTLEKADRFPGKAIYECHPRSDEVTSLWNDMYRTGQQCPYLNNSKSVHSLDEIWAENKKLTSATRNGAFILADIFDIMSELPYATRRSVARSIRCYLVLMANSTQVSTPLAEPTRENIKSFINVVSAENSQTKGVLDQRLVDFLTNCIHEYMDWAAFGLGSSVNESNASGKKYGDVEYLNLDDRIHIHAYEAHGGGLRDEYIESHINSLCGTVEYHKSVAEEHGEEYRREVEVIYVAHDISRLSRYRNGHTEVIAGVPFTFRFITFHDLLTEAGGIDAACEQIELFGELVHGRISRLPDAYSLKTRYCQIIEQMQNNETLC